MLGSIIGAIGAGSAADAQSEGLEQAMAMQAQQYKQSRADLAPWRQTGGQAVNALWDMIYGQYGGTSEEVAMSEAEYMKTLTEKDLKKYQKQKKKGGTFEDLVPDWKRTRTKYDMGGGPSFEQFEKSPYYDFLMGEGTKALERGASAKGMQLSGAENKALTEYGQNLASTDYDNWLRRWYQSLTPLQSLAGQGMTAGAQTGQMSQNFGNSMASLLGNRGTSNAAGIMGTTNSLAQGANQLENGIMQALMGGMGGL